jgi:Protein of unknown function (DUF3037)
MAEIIEMGTTPASEQGLAYHILRYVPNLVRDEWVNIGVLVFNPRTGERGLRLIEDQVEYTRVRRLHPSADEALLRALRDDLEDRLDPEAGYDTAIDLEKILRKCDETLSTALQIAPQKGVLADDLDAELERLYTDHVAVPRIHSRVGQPGNRATIRAYCAQVFRQARIWNRIDKSVRVAEFTFPGDPSRLDYGYYRNGTRGFMHTLPLRARHRMPSHCPITLSILPRKRATTRSLRPSPMWPCPATTTATDLFWIHCAKSASNPFPWRGWPFGSPSCGLSCCNSRFHVRERTEASHFLALCVPCALYAEIFP